MKRITIIGGGASGTLLTANLLRLSDEQAVTVDLVDRKQRVGLGVAYSTDQDTHLLNVPANKMGAFPDDVEHFYRWLCDNDYAFDPHDFVPRRIFGQYLRSVLQEASERRSEHATMNFIDDDAVDMEIGSKGTAVQLGSGGSISSDFVVLAFGNFLPPHPFVEGEEFKWAEKYFQNPWSRELYEKISSKDSVLIVGTGLTMVDIVLQFDKLGHTRKISAISTRGLLPAVHELGHSYPPFHDEVRSKTRITDLHKIVRKHIKTAEAQGSNWRGVIDSLRPVTQEIWQNLPTAEKRYFMQHLSRFWDVARHRMAPSAAAVIERMQLDERLKILRGRLKRIDVTSKGSFEVEYAVNGKRDVLKADVLINCIGSESNFERLDSPFVRNLIKRGHIKNDPVSLGIDALPNGSVLGKNEHSSASLWTLGTPLKGILWESTAIPEIRTQAKRLAEQLLTA